MKWPKRGRDCEITTAGVEKNIFVFPQLTVTTRRRGAAADCDLGWL